jgi:hypothetical protein
MNLASVVQSANRSVIEEYRLDCVDDGLVITDDSAWTYLRLRTFSYDVLSTGEKMGHLARGDRLFYGLRGRVGHLLVISRIYPVATWADDLRQQAVDPTPGWDPFVTEVAAHLQGQAVRTREVYLGVRLGDRPKTLLSSMAGRVEQPLGLRDPRPSDDERQVLREQVEDLLEAIGDPTARPATDAELRLLVHHAHWRGTRRDAETVEMPRRPAWGGEAVALADCQLRIQPGRIRLGTDDDKAFTTSVAIKHIPARSEFPGAREWFAGLPAGAEISMHFQVLTAAEAAGLARGQARVARDQANHDAEVNAEPGADVVEAERMALEMEATATRDKQPVIRCWPRIILTAPDERQLERKVQELRSNLADYGIEVEQTSDWQAHLFVESLIGSTVNLPVFEQLMPPSTLAGTMFQASSNLGDERGFYQGVTLRGATRNLVMLDPVGAGEADQPTGISITGPMGKGKSFLAFGKFAYPARLYGADVLIIDPHRQATALTQMDGLGFTQVIEFGPEHAGRLDPFRVIPDHGQAAIVAADVARAMLSPTLAAAVDSWILTAALQEAGQDQPSMRGMLRWLLEANNDDARHAGDFLRGCADRLALAQSCFGVGTLPPLQLKGALTVVQFGGITLPGAGKPKDDFSSEERLGLALMRAVTALVHQMLAMEDRHRRKLIVFDEYWTVGQSESGGRMADEVNRTGRKTNTHLVLVTQKIRDLGGAAELVGMQIQFGTDNESEIADVRDLFALEPDSRIAAELRSLPSGQCLVRDRQHRLGFLQVDAYPDRLRRLFTTPDPRAQQRQGVVA